MKLCRRKTDGAMYRPSYLDGYDRADAVADCLRSGPLRFYFRRVEFRPGRWLPFPCKGRWIDTGEVWEPESGEFDVIDA